MQTRNTGSLIYKEVNEFENKKNLEKEFGKDDKKGKIDKEIDRLNKQIDTFVKQMVISYLHLKI